MRRALLLVCVLLSACTSASDPDVPDGIASRDAPSSATPTPRTSTPGAVATLEPEDDCAGLGRVPRQGQVTTIEEGQLRAYDPERFSSKCLATVASDNPNFMSDTRPPRWSPEGDRVLIGGRAISADGAVTKPLAAGSDLSAEWSRPTGTSVVSVASDGRLLKQSSFGGRPEDISFLARHDDVAYHPAGLHIATSGLTSDGEYGLYLATNLGTEVELIARGEAARFITNLRFAEDGQSLYYTARHDPTNWHLHRLFIGADPFLATLAKQQKDFEYAVSSFNNRLIAWFVPGDCAAGEPGKFKVVGGRLGIKIPGDLRERNIHPVGWLRAGQLVVRVASPGCSAPQPGTVYVLSHEAPVVIDEENYGEVSVRVRRPPPPPPPDEEQDVVA